MDQEGERPSKVRHLSVPLRGLKLPNRFWLLNVSLSQASKRPAEGIETQPMAPRILASPVRHLSVPLRGLKHEIPPRRIR